MNWTLPIAFTTPWLLWGLLALPLLWLLLRAIPPAPVRKRFPGVALLLGLDDETHESDRTPWWLLLLRMCLVAAAIVGLAGPVLNPEDRSETEDGPLLVIFDGTWADAGDWSVRLERADALIARAGRNGRPVAVMTLTRPAETPPAFQSADIAQGQLAGLAPAPYAPDEGSILAWRDGLAGSSFETIWFSDGLERPAREALVSDLRKRGRLTVIESARPVYGLRPAAMEDGVVTLSLVRVAPSAPSEVPVVAIGRDPAGQERVLARGDATFADGEDEAAVSFNLPPELLARITRFAVEGQRSAGAVTLADDTLRRREVALIAGREQEEGSALLSPTHYLERALAPSADLIEGSLSDILPANPDVIVLADVATLPEGQTRDIAEWVARGGTLLRFAGPQLAASDVSRDFEDPLMPVRLRAGGRSVGGTMSWGTPKKLQPFAEDSPFFGLQVPDDVSVSSQVLAQPDPALADRVIASLADGTPLVTRKRLGDGQVVLFHVNATGEWSSLPLSGLFIDMLDRLAVSGQAVRPPAEDIASTTWVAQRVLDGFGALGDVDALAGVDGERLAEGVPGPDLPPGLYSARTRDASVALNVISDETELERAEWPAGIVVEGLTVAREMSLKGVFLMLALVFLAVDTLASLALGGRLSGLRIGRSVRAAGIAVAAFGLIGLDSRVHAQQDDAFAIAATRDVVLAHVLTGSEEVDRVAQAGLAGLGQVLRSRTAIEPGEPMGVDPERDELSLFPFLYWPVTENQPQLSDTAYAKLNRYLRTGGMILFDTRDAGVGEGASPAARRLRSLALPLDIPPLEPLPEDHVLTRAFYLLQDFPGRYNSRAIWVEAAPADAARAEGMPFRDLNDGVTPVVIGGNDWASAWAVDRQGRDMFPVGRGYAGERQREIARRFGVNLIMHVLTGNYKSDQVHVPALLERLGQ